MPAQIVEAMKYPGGFNPHRFPTAYARKLSDMTIARGEQVDAISARYVRTSERLRKRYTVGNSLTVSEQGKPTRYAILADMAWERFQAAFPA